MTDPEVEEALTSLREQHATFPRVEGRALADAATLRKFHWTASRSRAKDNRCTWTKCWWRSLVRPRCPNSPENLRGAAAGMRTTFDVNYPQDSSDQRLAGKTFSYTVKVHCHQTEEPAGVE